MCGYAASSGLPLLPSPGFQGILFSRWRQVRFSIFIRSSFARSTPFLLRLTISYVGSQSSGGDSAMARSISVVRVVSEEMTFPSCRMAVGQASVAHSWPFLILTVRLAASHVALP